MNPDVAFVIPTWNRENMFRDSLLSLVNQDYEGPIDILVVDDQSTDETKNCFQGIKYAIENDRWPALGFEKPPGSRTVRWQVGPGFSNWRPGSIHRPFFELALMSKAMFVGYQFSDDMSLKDRVRTQVEAMESGPKANWTYAAKTIWIDALGRFRDTSEHQAFHPRQLTASRNPVLPVYSFLVRRQNFVEAGGCDYPLHVGACAEAWIIANCCLTGRPIIHPQSSFMFRRHEEALGGKQGPGSKTYHAAVERTGFIEEDHWRLWRHVEPVYQDRVRRAKEQA